LTGSAIITHSRPATGGNAWTWIDGNGASGAGTETYLGDGGAILWALYTGVLGIQPDFQGITLEPHIPAALADARTEIRLLGHHLKFQIRGSGDKLESLTVNGRPSVGNRLSWAELNEGAEITAVVAEPMPEPKKQ
jgi:cellobiose phosphorylase